MHWADFAFIGTGIVIVAVVGRLLAYSGRRYVGGAGGAGRNVGSIATLVSVVFHLVTLGLVALLTAIPVSTGPRGFLIKVGLLCLILGLVYAAAVGVLARRREVAVTESALSEPPDSDDPDERPSMPTHPPSYIPPSGIGDGT
ncbi:MAG: hypothetical protein J2P24_10680 [Streptosporangiales bacterium]|nr:hypothetical protein [Streptosporangiales bacterium]MBO0890502.1 hypothetical protein [Acidothermales bacterium]